MKKNKFQVGDLLVETENAWGNNKTIYLITDVSGKYIEVQYVDNGVIHTNRSLRQYHEDDIKQNLVYHLPVNK